MRFQDILDQYNIPYLAEGHEHCRTGWLQLDCPHCSRDAKRWRLGYNLTFGYLNCWACGRHRIVDTLIEFGVPTREATRLFHDIDRERPAEKKHTGKLVLPKGIGPLLSAHRRYLRNRGFDAYELERLWGIQGIGIAAKLQWRIFIPIYFQGEVVSWTTRSISDNHHQRYRSAGAEEEAIPHKTILFGEDYIRHTAIVVEGPFDAMAIGPGAVATCGTGFSRAQVRRIARLPRRVVCFDSTPEGQQKAEELCSLLEVMPGETINVTLDAKDAGEASDKEIRQLRKAFLEV